MLSEFSCHLRNEVGTAIPDEDALTGYVGHGGLVVVKTTVVSSVVSSSLVLSIVLIFTRFECSFHLHSFPV